MSPTRYRSAGLAMAASLALTTVGMVAPATAADSPEAAVNQLLDASVSGDYDAIDTLVCEAERSAVRSMLDPGEAMDVEMARELISFSIEDRAVEVVDEDGDEATVRVTGTMSMGVGDGDVEEVARMLVEADMGELSEEDLEMMLPFMEMALTQTVPIDEELTVVREADEWVVCGGLGVSSVDDYDFETTNVSSDGLCGLVLPEELTAAGSVAYESSSGWALNTCSYQDSDYTQSTTVTVELDADAAYAAGAYGYDVELEVAGAPAFTSDQPGAPLLVQVGPDVLNVQVQAWDPGPTADDLDLLEQTTAIAELFAPRVAESRDALIEPVPPLLCDLAFAGDLEAAVGMPMHFGSVDDQSCSYESRDDFSVNAYVSEGTIEQYRQFYAEAEDATFAGMPALEVSNDPDQTGYSVVVELPGERLLTVDVRPSAYDKPMTVSGSEVVELLTRHIVDKSAE
jgi:hypothetical protein